MKPWIVYGQDGKPLAQVEAENMKDAMRQADGAAAATAVIPYRQRLARARRHVQESEAVDRMYNDELTIEAGEREAETARQEAMF